jgi:hypothetical protein
VRTRQARPKNFLVRNVRIHKEYFDRLNALTEELERVGDYAPDGHLKEGDKLRLALRVGIEALEREMERRRGQ